MRRTQRALRTPRLRLEPPHEGHLPALVDIHRRNAARFEARVARIVRNRRQAARWLLSSECNLRYVIIERTAGTVMGMISLSNIQPMPFASATLGYWLDADYAGQGYAREAAQRIVRFAFTSLKLHRLEANIDPRNRRSRRLLRALGFRFEGKSPRMLFLCGQWRDQHRYALLRDEWKG